MNEDMLKFPVGKTGPRIIVDFQISRTIDQRWSDGSGG